MALRESTARQVFRARRASKGSPGFMAKQGFKVQASGGVKDLSDLWPLADIPGIVGAISGKALMEGFILLDDPHTRQALAGGA